MGKTIRESAFFALFGRRSTSAKQAGYGRKAKFRQETETLLVPKQ
jgi:hypothetical protein